MDHAQGENKTLKGQEAARLRLERPAEGNGLLKHLLSLAARKVFASAINEVAGARGYWQKSERNQRAHVAGNARLPPPLSLSQLGAGLSLFFHLLSSTVAKFQMRATSKLFKQKFWLNRYFNNPK